MLTHKELLAMEAAIAICLFENFEKIEKLPEIKGFTCSNVALCTSKFDKT